MERKQFLKTIFTGALGMSTLSAFNRFSSELKTRSDRMPVLFIGHGSPMNGIEDNEFSRNWKNLAHELPEPTAVLVISAHWLTRGTHITAMDFPRTIHDFGGFPDELFQVQYAAPGSPALAKEAAALIKTTSVGLDHDWGLDHGAWTIIRHMYPDPTIPVLQLSIDFSKGPQYHYDLSRQLSELRKKGVLIIGSGNMVHNLRMVAWDQLDKPEFGYDWAIEMNSRFKELIGNGNDDALIKYEALGKAAQLSIPTPEHYWPLLYTLGIRSAEEKVSFFNDRVVGGSLTMTSVQFG